MFDTLILNATLINEGEIFSGDIGINNGRIESIGTNLASHSAKHTVDAQGKHLLPGMIDSQVHFREPGLTHKGTIYTESRAAVAGGITSFMEMPNVNPPTLTRDALEAKYRLAQRGCFANYAFYFGTSNDNIEEVKRLKTGQACGTKIFMGASTGNLLVNDPKALNLIFQHCPTLISTHCEDTPMIQSNEALARAQFGDDIPISWHPRIRSEAACYASSSLAVELAQKHHAQLHVLHLTTAKEMVLFSNAALKDKNITAEACIHHLWFNKQDYATKGSLIKCNPAIKKESDRQALITALKDGKIDIIATDHAPHTWAEKQNVYTAAPSGLPLVQQALLTALELCHRQELSLTQLVQKTSHNVAERFKLKERGYIREGYYADLVLVDLNAQTTACHSNSLSKCAWTPFHGTTFNSQICATWVNGRLAFDGEQVRANTAGQRLIFGAQR